MSYHWEGDEIRSLGNENILRKAKMMIFALGKKVRKRLALHCSYSNNCSQQLSARFHTALCSNSDHCAFLGLGAKWITGKFSK